MKLARFCGGVLLLSTPFWWLGWRVHDPSLPGGLPASALMVVAPAAVGVLLAAMESGRAGLRALWVPTRVRITRRRALWWMASAATMPCVLAASLLPLARLGDFPDVLALPGPGALALLGALYLVAAAVEEIGWTGYATDEAVQRFGEAGGGALLGTVWAVWHIVPWLQMGHSAGWIVAQCSFSVLLRVLQVTVYAETGRARTPVVLLHATANLSLIPDDGRLYDPLLASIILLVPVSVARRVGRRRPPVPRPPRPPPR